MFRTKFRIHHCRGFNEEWYEVSEKLWYWPWWERCCYIQFNIVFPMIFDNILKARQYIHLRKNGTYGPVNEVIELH